MTLRLVAVLGLLALFTHNHAFWIAGLLLALVPLPDFTTPLGSIARSLERLADGVSPASAPPPEPSTPHRAAATPAHAGTPAREAPPSAADHSAEPKED